MSYPPQSRSLRTITNMTDIIRLDERHGAELYKVFTQNKDVGGLLLVQHRETFLISHDGIALTCLEGKELKQTLVGEIKGDTCFTRGIFGEIGDHTVDLLDSLCTICSSNDPLVVEHKFVVQPKQIDAFKALWPKTRLGKMSINDRWLAMTFRATIQYPPT